MSEAAGSTAGRSALLRPLRHREFRKLWAGQAFSALGNGITPVALTLLILRNAGSATNLGLVLGAQSVGLVALVLVGGQLADRLSRTRVMAGSDVLRAGATLAFAVFGDVVGLPIYIVLAFVLGAGAALFEPAERALLPSLVPDADLQAANALTSVTARAALIAGPPIGAALATAFDPRVAFAVDAATFVVSVLSLLLIRRTPRPDTSDEPDHGSLVGGAWQGLRAVRERPWAAAVIVQGALQVLLVHAPAVALIPLVLRDEHELGLYGLVLAVQAVGAVLGGLLIARWSPTEPGTVALLGMLAGLPTLLVLLFRLPTSLLAITMILTGASGSVFAVLWSSALQRHIPNHVLGRVVALDYVGQLGLEPAGLALTAPAVDGLGLSPVIAACAVALVLTTALPFLAPNVRTFGGTNPPQASG